MANRAEILRAVIKSAPNPTVNGSLGDRVYWEIASCIKMNEDNQAESILRLDPHFEPDLELINYATDHMCLNTRSLLIKQMFQVNTIPPNPRRVYLLILAISGSELPKSETLSDFHDAIYWDIAKNIQIGNQIQAIRSLNLTSGFQPDFQLLSYADRHNLHGLVALMCYRMKCSASPQKETSSQVSIQELSRKFSRLSNVTLEEIVALYPNSDSSIEALEFRRILAERKREEEKIRLVIDTCLSLGWTGLLDPYLPLHATAFRYLVGEHPEDRKVLIDNYLLALQVKCRPEDLSDFDILEYYSILRGTPQTHYNLERFVLWQKDSLVLREKLIEQADLNSLGWIIRVVPENRALLNRVKMDGKTLEDYQEKDLAKLAQKVTHIGALSYHGITSKAQVAHIGKGNKVFETWRDSLPDTSPPRRPNATK